MEEEYELTPVIDEGYEEMLEASRIAYEQSLAEKQAAQKQLQAVSRAVNSRAISRLPTGGRP